MGTYETEPTERHEELFHLSEATVKQITGVCASITERNGWTEFEIDGGGQYPTKLSTKLQPLIELGRAAGQNLAVWTYKESQGKENPNRPGSYYMNRYLDKVEVGGTAETQPDATASPSTAPVVGTDKDRLIVRQTCIKAAAEFHSQHAAVAEDVLDTAAKFEKWVTTGILDPVPFL